MMVSKGQHSDSKTFVASSRKVSKLVPYKMGSGAALGAFRVLVGRH